MSRLTEKALISNFKKMTERMPIDKITVSELCRECGIQRQTFYYHYKDIRDLVESIYDSELDDALQDNKTYTTWQEGLTDILEAVRKDKSFITASCRSLSQDQLEGFLYDHLMKLLLYVVNQIAEGHTITEAQKESIARYHMYAFAGVILNWIMSDMKEDPKDIVHGLEIVVGKSLSNAVMQYEEENLKKEAQGTALHEKES